mgnify:CR=1 FL=1
MKKIYILDSFKKKQNYDLICFLIGIFLLPSAFIISGIFLLTALIISTIKYRSINKFFKDQWNISFLIASLLMILSALMQSFNNKNLIQYDLDINLTWIGLLNWLPFFWLFWGFKPYLNSPAKRRICGLMLLTGTVPVIFSGLGQVFFNWNGPISTLYNTIIWYQRPIEIVKGLTGLFNNQNYAGSWLNIVWPFSLALLIEVKGKIYEKITLYFYIFSLSLSIILTNSRSAWLGIITGSIFFFGKKSYGTLKNIFMFIMAVLIASIYPTSREYIIKIGNTIIPDPIISEFSDFQYSRIDIWFKGIDTVLKHPLFGTGAGSFPSIFQMETGLWKGHAHNLPLELIISYGIPAGICVIVPIIFLTFLSIKNLFSKKKIIQNILFEKAWIVALFILLLSQMLDVQYFDGRISIVLWLLLSGTKNIISEKTFN